MKQDFELKIKSQGPAASVNRNHPFGRFGPWLKNCNPPIALEVEQLLGNNTVRAFSMTSTIGLSRGLKVHVTWTKSEIGPVLDLMIKNALFASNR